MFAGIEGEITERVEMRETVILLVEGFGIDFIT